jgi:hypothetical protein
MRVGPPVFDFALYLIASLQLPAQATLNKSVQFIIGGKPHCDELARCELADFSLKLRRKNRS